MMEIRQNESNTARRTIYITAVNTSDNSVYTGALSGSDIKVSKAGGALANSTGSATHLGAGLFAYTFSTTEVNTLGEVAVQIAKSGLYNDTRVITVTGYNPYDNVSLGLINLDAAISTRLATSNYDSLSSIFNEPSTIEAGLSLRDALRLIAAATAGRNSGAGSGTEIFRSAVSNSKQRINASVDVSGNRTNITYDLSD